jgi:hypothetical protein
MLRWCRTFAILAACLAIAAGGASAEEMLYPHTEREDGPWGYIDKAGKVVISLQFASAQPFSEGLAAVEVRDGDGTPLQKFGFIDRTGALVIPAQFTRVQRLFRSGRAAVKLGSWGLIDRNGKLILPATYAFVGPFSDGRAIVGVPDVGSRYKFGGIDLDGQVVVPLENDSMSPFSEGLAAAKRGGKFGYVDKRGTAVVPFQFWHAGPFNAGLATVLKGANGESGFIDRRGTMVVSFSYGGVGEFSEGYAVAIGQGYALVDPAGRTVARLPGVEIGGRFQSIYPHRSWVWGWTPPPSPGLSEGLLPVRTSFTGKSYGYVDKQGTFVIPPQFDHAWGFHDGVAAVAVNVEIGFGVKGLPFRHFSGMITKTGQFVAPPVFDAVHPHPGGLLQVKFGKRLGYIDTRGRPLTFTVADLDAHVAETREKLKREAAAPPSPPSEGWCCSFGSTKF